MLVAHAALILCIPVCVLLFTRLPSSVAACTAILGATLLLPKDISFDVKGLPPMNGDRIAMLTSIVTLLVFRPQVFRLRRRELPWLMLPLLLAIGCVFTVLSNREPVGVGPRDLPGMHAYDIISLIAAEMLDLGLPFVIGLCVTRTPKDVQRVLTAVAVAGALYSLPILVELRMSPQFHRWVYGYHQQQFAQTIRFGGWRPVVFMEHGLALAIFVLSCCIALAGITRAGLRPWRIPPAPVTAYLSALLVACKSLASIVYGFVLIPLAAFTSPRVQLRVAIVVASVIVLYPLLRTSDIFPAAGAVSAARAISKDRAASLEFRLHNEDMLLEKARRKILFGWGTWGRNRVYDAAGRDISITDGFWIIQLGMLGLVGFGASFGIFLVPIFVAQRRIRAERSRVYRSLIAAVSLIVLANAVDLVPNGFLEPYAVFLAGSLAALPAHTRGRRRAMRRVPEPGSPGSSGARGTRSPTPGVVRRSATP